MEAVEMIKTKANADTEEWDIIGRAPPGWVEEQCEAAKRKKSKPKAAAGEGVDPLVGAALVLELVLRQKNAEPFSSPVDWKGLGLDDYPQVISRPMDLGTIQNKLRKGKYSSIGALAEDVGLIWANAMEYNQEGSPVYKAAAALKAFADKKLEPLQVAARKRAEAEAAASVNADSTPSSRAAASNTSN
eukprot:scaffold8849_cov101-Isochrysis_galbana.AAC.3